MNYATIAGYLGADPEVRFTSSGQKVTTFRVGARCRRSKGEDVTIWWRVTIWGELFDKMIPYLKKGSAVLVMGDINNPEIFTDRDGKPQVSMSMTASHVSFSPFGKPAGADASAVEKGTHSPEIVEAVVGQGKATSFADDEVPF